MATEYYCLTFLNFRHRQNGSWLTKQFNLHFVEFRKGRPYIFHSGQGKNRKYILPPWWVGGSCLRQRDGRHFAHKYTKTSKLDST